MLKIWSHAAVWSCHVLVLRLLCTSTGVTIMMPKVLIIYRRWGGQRGRERLGHCHPNSLTDAISAGQEVLLAPSG